MSAFFLSTGVSPDVSGDDEDDDEGGACPVSQSIKHHRWSCIFFSTRIVVSISCEGARMRKRSGRRQTSEDSREAAETARTTAVFPVH